MKNIKIINEYKTTTFKELWIDGVLSNFIYGFLGASLIVAVTLKIDIAVLGFYIIYYFFLGKVVNRPKYVTSLGKFIVFPFSTAFGAFTGYKLSPYIVKLLILIL